MSISRLMSNLRGPSEDKRKLLANVFMPVLLYGAKIWADTINARQYRRTEMVLVQRKAALRCVSAYRTVSTEAVSVLAGIPLIEIVRTSAGGYTALHIESNQRVQKRCGSGVKKGKSCSVNGRNGSPKALKESGPIY